MGPAAAPAAPAAAPAAASQSYGNASVPFDGASRNSTAQAAASAKEIKKALSAVLKPPARPGANKGPLAPRIGKPFPLRGKAPPARPPPRPQTAPTPNRRGTAIPVTASVSQATIDRAKKYAQEARTHAVREARKHLRQYGMTKEAKEDAAAFMRSAGVRAEEAPDRGRSRGRSRARR